MTLYEQVHYRDRGASFLQPTFQVTFFVPNAADISESPDKNLINFLTFRSKFLMQCLSWGKVKQDFSSMSIVV
jgi:hypothetical protein